MLIPNCCIEQYLEYIAKKHQGRLDLVVQGPYSESLYASSLLLRLLCCGMSVAFRYAGCFATQGWTLRVCSILHITLASHPAQLLTRLTRLCLISYTTLTAAKKTRPMLPTLTLPQGPFLQRPV
jgi:hypothetical protein